ncbi:hypothetical protein G8J22_00801 [Lentilactobacillus hilgardii]|uniref:Ig-like domain-containing protein n=1 Tax=Lentilactobacillus hilgardii TaxID=1588 RepID=UPI00019C545F|nr:Ig-like domain-containing protein [Lentilactobacillus hilgardii]EEI20112.1 hypothetical protein HMPREF0497_1114 [Lentilactobacillus buchneri ATCC 11577]MCT3396701.1 hypothetical protein [Lentilactobacillus hilgardii]QIR08867.1 hypothetical protein G8J22_00801 [Lentilactobacillus hilgardii]
MNKYVLSALVVPVALMGAVTAQAKTTLLKATVNQAKSGTKVVSGKATRGAKIKISRAGVTYGVAKANKHGHFVMKLKRAVKGGWTYKVTVTKAGFKVKSGHFKVKRTKKPAKVAVPSKTTPTKPVSVSKPSAPVASSTPSAKPVVSTAVPKTNANTNPRPNISAVDIEAYQINTEMASLNRQLDLAGFGQQRLATSLRTSLGNQIDQLQNRVNVFATQPGVNSATISSMNNELTMLRQKFNGLPNTFVLSGSKVATQPAADQSQNEAKANNSDNQKADDMLSIDRIAHFQWENKVLKNEINDLVIQIAHLENDYEMDTSKSLDQNESDHRNHLDELRGRLFKDNEEVALNNAEIQKLQAKS